MTLRETLDLRIRTYLSETGMTEGRFSHEVARDYSWLGRFRNGQASLRSIERAEALIEGRPLPGFGPPPTAQPEQAA